MVAVVKRGDIGERVERLQVALEELGHDLPRYGCDGEAGGETFAAAGEFCRAHRLPVYEEELPTLLLEVVTAFAALLRHAPAGSLTTSSPTWPGAWLVDYRDQHRDRWGRQRAWEDVTGITLHQTACHFSSADALDRVAKIRAHAVILRNGSGVLNAPLNRVMYHGHAFNAHDVGLEIDGYYAGVEGDLGTFWKPKSRPDRKPMGASEEQIDNARAFCRWVVETVAARGGEVRYVHAHRQTHAGKPSDPGELIWKGIGLWCQEELGLSDGGPGFYVPHDRHKKAGPLSSSAGPGRPIPTEWDDRRVNTYDWRPAR
jgi:hypothetical protein